jgi:hypothetical protein
VLAHQYRGQLTREMAEAIDANARNKVYFALAPKDAIDQAHHVKTWLDDGDLMRLGGFEVVLRPIVAGRVVPPVTADTLAPPEPIPGRADELRAAARARTGLDMATRRAMLGDAATTGVTHERDQAESRLAVAVPGRQQPSNFDRLSNPRGEGPHEESHEEPQGASTSADPTGHPAPVNTPSAHVTGTEEDP